MNQSALVRIRPGNLAQQDPKVGRSSLRIRKDLGAWDDWDGWAALRNIPRYTMTLKHQGAFSTAEPATVEASRCLGCKAADAGEKVSKRFTWSRRCVAFFVLGWSPVRFQGRSASNVTSRFQSNRTSRQRNCAPD